MKDISLRGTPAAAAAAAAAAESAAAAVTEVAADDGRTPASSAASLLTDDISASAAAAANPSPELAPAVTRLPRKVNKKFSPAEHDSFSGPGGVPMTLEQVQQRIQADAEYVPVFWREKYEADAARNWDIFYSINSRNFFKVATFSFFCPSDD
jgi:hypothetical protein